MLLRALQGLALAATLGACADGEGDPRHGPLTSLDEMPAPGADTRASGRRVARSIWGVVPVPPARKADLRPDMIEGSAVAVAAYTLLANCAVLRDRATVGLVRHNKYRLARVEGDHHGGVCRLRVDQGPLTPAAGWRSFGDLRVGEPVVALASRTSAEVAAAPGWLAGKGDPGDPFLEATAAVPAGNRSAILVDGFGNLIGLGAAAALPGALLLAVPIANTAAPEVANRDRGGDEVLAAVLTPNPRDQPVAPPVLLVLGGDGRDDLDRPPADRRGEPASRAAPQAGGSGGAGGGGTGNGGAGGGSSGDGETEGGAGNGAGSPGSDSAGGGEPAADPGVGPAPAGDGGATGGGGIGTMGDDGRGGRGRGRGGPDRHADADDDHSGRGRGRGGRDRDRSGEDGGRGRGRVGDD